MFNSVSLIFLQQTSCSSSSVTITPLQHHTTPSTLWTLCIPEYSWSLWEGMAQRARDAQRDTQRDTQKERDAQRRALREREVHAVIDTQIRRQGKSLTCSVAVYVCEGLKSSFSPSWFLLTCIRTWHCFVINCQISVSRKSDIKFSVVAPGAGASYIFSGFVCFTGANNNNDNITIIIVIIIMALIIELSYLFF